MVLPETGQIDRYYPVKQAVWLRKKKEHYRLALLAHLDLTSLQHANEVITGKLTALTSVISTGSSVLLCFVLFFRFPNKSMPCLQNLFGASYSVYLVHQIFVVCLRLSIIRLHAEPALALHLLILVVFPISYAIHSR